MTPYLIRKMSKRSEACNIRSHGHAGALRDLASNDYLGLARCLQFQESVTKEWKNASEAYRSQQRPLNGLGSTGSRLLTGNSEYAEVLERHIAAFHGYESALLFNCGYMANVGLLSTIAGETDAIIYDAEIHASTADGIRLSGAQAFPFRHLDLDHLEKRLKALAHFETRFIVIESIYSTDGSMAPLMAIAVLAKHYGAKLIVDEAHAVGIRGPSGRGLVAELLLQDMVFAQVVTFGKALGVHGAAVLGSSDLINVLINFATSHIYTTAMPLHSLAAIQCSYAKLPELDAEREKLDSLIQFMGDLNDSISYTHIQSVLMPGNIAVKGCSSLLKSKGFDVRPLTSPTVKGMVQFWVTA